MREKRKGKKIVNLKKVLKLKEGWICFCSSVSSFSSLPSVLTTKTMQKGHAEEQQKNGKKKGTLGAGIEPATTRLKVVRSTELS